MLEKVNQAMLYKNCCACSYLKVKRSLSQSVSGEGERQARSDRAERIELYRRQNTCETSNMTVCGVIMRRSGKYCARAKSRSQ